MLVVTTQGFPDSDVQFTLHAMSFKFRYLDMHVASFQVRNVPSHGALYKSAIARLFRECGRGKAIYFEDTRYNFCWTFRLTISFLFSLAKCRSLLFLIVVISSFFIYFSVYFTVEHTLNLKDPNTWSRLCRPTQFCLPSTWLLKWGDNFVGTFSHIYKLTR